MIAKSEKLMTKTNLIDAQNKIWLSSPHMSEEGYELDFIKKAFETNWIAPVGENISEFEKKYQIMLVVLML